MANCFETLGACIDANRKIFKIVAIVLVVVVIGLIIGGAVLIALNPDNLYDQFEEGYYKSQRRFAGIALLCLGIFFLIASIVLSCAVFQLGFAKQITTDLGERTRLNE